MQSGPPTVAGHSLQVLPPHSFRHSHSHSLIGKSAAQTVFIDAATALPLQCCSAEHESAPHKGGEPVLHSLQPLSALNRLGQILQSAPDQLSLHVHRHTPSTTVAPPPFGHTASVEHTVHDGGVPAKPSGHLSQSAPPYFVLSHSEQSLPDQKLRHSHLQLPTSPVGSCFAFPLQSNWLLQGLGSLFLQDLPSSLSS